MKKALSILKLLLIAPFILLFVLGFGAEVSQPMPDYADVMVDDKAKIYHSPVHFYNNGEEGWQKLRLTKAGEARQLGYEPDSQCRNDGDFVNDKGSLLWSWLEDAGLYTPQPRWNKDGSWNW